MRIRLAGPTALVMRSSCAVRLLARSRMGKSLPIVAIRADGVARWARHGRCLACLALVGSEWLRARVREGAVRPSAGCCMTCTRFLPSTFETFELFGFASTTFDLSPFSWNVGMRESSASALEGGARTTRALRGSFRRRSYGGSLGLGGTPKPGARHARSWATPVAQVATYLVTAGFFSLPAQLSNSASGVVKESRGT